MKHCHTYYMSSNILESRIGMKLKGITLKYLFTYLLWKKKISICFFIYIPAKLINSDMHKMELWETLWSFRTITFILGNMNTSCPQTEMIWTLNYALIYILNKCTPWSKTMALRSPESCMLWLNDELLPRTYRVRKCRIVISRGKVNIIF